MLGFIERPQAGQLPANANGKPVGRPPAQSPISNGLRAKKIKTDLMSYHVPLLGWIQRLALDKNYLCRKGRPHTSTHSSQNDGMRHSELRCASGFHSLRNVIHFGASTAAIISHVQRTRGCVSYFLVKTGLRSRAWFGPFRRFGGVGVQMHIGLDGRAA